jgi:hypothetical protein
MFFNCTIANHTIGGSPAYFALLAAVQAFANAGDTM